MSEFNNEHFAYKYLKYKKKYLELSGGNFDDTFWQAKLVDDTWLKEADKSKLDVWYEIPFYYRQSNIHGNIYSTNLIKEYKLKEITIRNNQYINIRKIQFINKDSDKSNTWQVTSDEGTDRWIDCTPERNTEINTKKFLDQLIPEKHTRRKPIYYIKYSILNPIITNNNKFRKFYIIPESDMYN